jgi:hypothetical protein
MKINKIISYAGAMLIVTSCSNDPALSEWGSVALQVNATIDAEATTRLGTTATAFTEGNEITVFASEGSTVTGYTYTAAADGTFASTSGYVFNTEQTVQFFAYYPTVSSDEIAIDLTGEQSDALDQLYAESVTAHIAYPTVNFTFKHLMSKLTFVLKDGGGFSSFKDATVTLENVPLTTGTLYPKQRKLVNEAGQTPATITAVLTTEETTTAEVILFPAAEAQTFTLKITLGEISYTKELSLAPTAGINYAYEVTVTKQGLYIASPVITAWNDVLSNGELSLKVPTE